MKVIDPGHHYEIESYDGGVPSKIRFMKRAIVPGRTMTHPGTNCQELLRVVIDRVMVLNREKPWSGNGEILFALRNALLMFEMRALMRKLSKGTLQPERMATSPTDGHFILTETDDGAP